MSAIGSAAILKREAFADCLRLAAAVRAEWKGWGPFKRSIWHGREAFERAWDTATVEAIDFPFSGYVLGDFLAAQHALTGARLDQLEQSAAALALSRVFTSAIPFEQPMLLPELPAQALHDFCVREYGAEAEGMFEALQAADQFYRMAIARLSPEQVVVFLIG